MNIWQLNWWLVACGTTLGCHETGVRYEMTATTPLQMLGCCSKIVIQNDTCGCQKGQSERKGWTVPWNENICLNWLLGFVELHEACQATRCYKEVSAPHRYTRLETEFMINQTVCLGDAVLMQSDGPSHQPVICRAPEVCIILGTGIYIYLIFT